MVRYKYKSAAVAATVVCLIVAVTFTNCSAPSRTLSLSRSSLTNLRVGHGGNLEYLKSGMCIGCSGDIGVVEHNLPVRARANGWLYRSARAMNDASVSYLCESSAGDLALLDALTSFVSPGLMRNVARP